MTRRSPIVGVVSDSRALDGRVYDVVEELYLVSLVRSARAVPVVIPALGPELDLAALLSRLDGILLTGSHSNIEPHTYGAENLGRDQPRDLKRDATTLPLVRAVMRCDLPLLAICRGLQEVNVALGGTLHQDLAHAGFVGHRDPRPCSVEEKYAPRHEVDLVQNGLLHAISGLRESRVNSVHQQGIRELAPGAIAIAHARDGLVEAFTLPQLRAFNVAIQWHPEWHTQNDPLSRAIFSAFGDACSMRIGTRADGIREPIA
jgi:putative glutamine amidotransferase